MKLLLTTLLLIPFMGPLLAQEADPWVTQEKALKEHFPNGLVDADGNKVELETLKGKAIGMYFSAAWCGPCRVFSPVLFAHRDKYADDFQVVFVSSDRSENAQKDYMKKNKMNCPTVKFGDSAKNALSTKYAVRSIPSLILLDHKGNFLTRDGRDFVTKGTDMSKITSGKIRMEKEEYLCGKCDKIHTREKLVIDE